MCNTTRNSPQPFSGLRLVGDITAVHSDGITMSVKSFDAQGREYNESIPVKLASGAEKLKVGQKVDLKGTLDIVDKRTCVIGDPATVVKVKKDEGYMNFARIIGRLAWKEGWSGDPSKTPFGFVLIETTAGKLFRSKFFRSMVSAIDNMVPINSTVAVEGALQNREYMNNGVADTFLELVVRHKDNFKIVARPEANDPLAGWTPSEPAGEKPADAPVLLHQP